MVDSRDYINVYVAYYDSLSGKLHCWHHQLFTAQEITKKRHASTFRSDAANPLSDPDHHFHSQIAYYSWTTLWRAPHRRQFHRKNGVSDSDLIRGTFFCLCERGTGGPISLSPCPRDPTVTLKWRVKRLDSVQRCYGESGDPKNFVTIVSFLL